MLWEPRGNNPAMISECGKYSIARYQMGAAKVYMLWLLTDPRQMLGKFPDFKSAAAKANALEGLESVKPVGSID